MKTEKFVSQSESVPTAEVVTGLLHEYLLNIHNEVQALKKRIEVLESVNVHFEWLSSKQAMEYLGCRSTKLWSLAKEGQIVQSGRLYRFKSCREYLLKNSVSVDAINERLLAILGTKKRV